MSDALIHTAVRAWSSRFSSWEGSASTRLNQCNRGFLGARNPAFPCNYPQRRNANITFHDSLYPHSSSLLALFKYYSPSKTHRFRLSAAA